MSRSDTSGTEMVSCDHCLQETSRASSIIVELNGENKVFCCKGCLGVYELIHNNSLDAFYYQRCGWQPGPPATEVKLQASAFSDTVTITGNEHRIVLLLSGIHADILHDVDLTAGGPADL